MPVEVKKHTGAPRPFLRRGEGLKRFQPDKPVAKASTGGQMRGQSTAAMSNQNLQSSQKTMKKSQSFTNMNAAGAANPPKRTLASKSLQSKSTTNLKNNPLSERTLAKLDPVVKAPSSVSSRNLKPAVQVSMAAMPVQQGMSEQATPAVNSDDELKEFEHLEQYVDEHPSFRSSVSFVENVMSKHGSKDKGKCLDLEAFSWIVFN